MIARIKKFYCCCFAVSPRWWKSSLPSPRIYPMRCRAMSRRTFCGQSIWANVLRIPKSMLSTSCAFGRWLCCSPVSRMVNIGNGGYRLIYLLFQLAAPLPYRICRYFCHSLAPFAYRYWVSSFRRCCKSVCNTRRAMDQRAIGFWSICCCCCLAFLAAWWAPMSALWTLSSRFQDS